MSAPRTKVEDIATCIGCGCDDLHACVAGGEPCRWLDVDRTRGLGVCSECPEHLGEFKRAYLSAAEGARA